VSNTWITDVGHFLDESGLLPDVPEPALSTAIFLGSIVARVTSRGATMDEWTNVACRCSLGWRRCRGPIDAFLTEDGSAAVWRCLICDNNIDIRGWEGTVWDRRSNPRWA